MLKEEVYSNVKKYQVLAKRISFLESTVETFAKTEKLVGDIEEVIILSEMEEDESLLTEIEGDFKKAKSTIEEMYVSSLLKGKYDGLNALVTLHSGAGGTESCDWVEMLYRMYVRYAERTGYTVTELD